MSFLIDTDICSAHLRHGGKISNRFIQHTGGLYISTISLAELMAWALRGNAPPRRQQALSEMLSDFYVLDVTEEISRKFGEIQAKLLDGGKPAPPMDLLIGATALIHDLTLVTHNTKDFANIPGLRILDWLANP